LRKRSHLLPHIAAHRRRLSETTHGSTIIAAPIPKKYIVKAVERDAKVHRILFRAFSGRVKNFLRPLDKQSVKVEFADDVLPRIRGLAIKELIDAMGDPPPRGVIVVVPLKQSNQRSYKRGARAL
jgi:hypothetical protein